MAATDNDDVVTVYRTTDSLDAHGLAAQMGDEGIEARVVGDFLTGGYGGLNFGKWGEIEVWVREADREAADRIAAAWDGKNLPTAHATSSPKFRFSLKTALVILTVGALLAAIRAMEPATAVAATAAAELLCWIAFVIFAMKRRNRVEVVEKQSATQPFD